MCIPRLFFFHLSLFRPLSVREEGSLPFRKFSSSPPLVVDQLPLPVPSKSFVFEGISGLPGLSHLPVKDLPCLSDVPCFIPHSPHLVISSFAFLFFFFRGTTLDQVPRRLLERFRSIQWVPGRSKKYPAVTFFAPFSFVYALLSISSFFFVVRILWVGDRLSLHRLPLESPLAVC